MGRIVSIHEYDLRPGINVEQFEQVLRDAEARGLLQLPGLVAHHFVKGAKGVRRGAYATLWIYESREAWEHLWGTAEHPRPPQEYPDTWKVWEQDILAPFLGNHPDAIRFTAYEESKGFDTVVDRPPNRE
jgi:heme-degrading monooxygenase HmoA